MPSLKDLIDNFQRLTEIISGLNWPSLSVLVGFFLLLLSCIFIYLCFKYDADKTPTSYKFGIYFCLISGLSVLASGAAATILNVFDNPVRRISKDEAIRRLGENEKVTWLIRLIPYSESNESKLLSIGAIKSLGPPQLQYVFVSPYEELRGYTVSDAVKMVGGSLDAGQQHVTAIIFRVGNRHIFPANARGVVQALRNIEQKKISDPSNKINIDDIISIDKYTAEKEDIDKDGDITSWSWSNYNENFGTYCIIAQKFRCNKRYEAHQYISEFNGDWSPLGYARTEPSETCRNAEKICKIKEKDWESISKQIKHDFGARVFLVDNFEIDTLGSRYLIDFDRPFEQVIPDIGPLR